MRIFAGGVKQHSLGVIENVDSRNTLGSLQRSSDSLAGGKRARCSSIPKNPIPAFGLCPQFWALLAWRPPRQSSFPANTSNFQVGIKQ